MSEFKIVNGDPAAVSVDRAISELRQGRIVRIHGGEKALYCAALETVAPEILANLLEQTATRLVITAERAAALGLGAKPVALRLPENTLTDTDFFRSACLSPASHAAAQQFADVAAEITTENQRGALQLLKLARLLPVLVTNEAMAGEAVDILNVGASEITRYNAARASHIERVSDASVPLRSGVNSRFILYRSADGAIEHLAIVVNQPDVSQSVLVRMHSSCLTGDLFGSMRCDCGEQLAKALDLLAVDGGVLLYLAQEGRNIGLANKLRAYCLQDAGCDTIEADALLGFRPDERYYDVGAAILGELGIDRIRLLTNNPTKVAALKSHGVSILERVPLTGTANPHNAFYLDTKRRAGHLL